MSRSKTSWKRTVTRCVVACVVALSLGLCLLCGWVASDDGPTPTATDDGARADPAPRRVSGATPEEPAGAEAHDAASLSPFEAWTVDRVEQWMQECIGSAYAVECASGVCAVHWRHPPARALPGMFFRYLVVERVASWGGASSEEMPCAGVFQFPALYPDHTVWEAATGSSHCFVVTHPERAPFDEAARARLLAWCRSLAIPD